MIVTVRGTKTNHNKAAHVVAMLGGISAVTKNRKILLLQLCQKVAIEDLLIGKKKSETEIRATGLNFDDTGVDALFRRIEGQGLQKEHFDACCTPILNSENLLDVATMSKKDNFETELLLKESAFCSLLEHAKDVYDDIYIYANGRNYELLEMLNKYTDLSIVCIRQGNKEEIGPLSEKHLYLATAYDDNSTFNVRYLKAMYKTKYIAKMPYNVEFKDAYNNGTLMSYISKNGSINENDISYPLFSAVEQILDSYAEGAPTPVESFPDFEKYVSEKNTTNYPSYKEPDVQVVEKKKGLFSPHKKCVIPGLAVQAEEEEIPDVEELFEEEEDTFEEEDANAETSEEEFEEDSFEQELPEDAETEEFFEEDPFEEEPAAEYSDDFEVPTEEPVEETSEEGDFWEDEEGQDDMLPEEEFEENESCFDDDAVFEEPFEEESEKEEVAEENNAEMEPEETVEATPVKMQQKSAFAEEWKCPDCGRENTKKFCPECGTKRPEPKQWYCPECGYRNTGYAKFCPECGTKRP